jgi:DNA polymerase-3 subunit delta
MALTSPESLTRALHRGSRGGVFFLFGDEEYLKEETAQALISAHLEPATRDFNLDQLRGASLEPEAFASVCQTPPMMAEWRVVVVREAQAIATAARLRETVEDLLARPVPGLVLILIAQLPEKSKAKFYQQLMKAATALEFRMLASADLPGWLISWAEQRGVELEPAAARALAAAVGSELGALIQEMSKLIEYVGNRRRIGTDDVAALVGQIPRQNRWDWIDAVADRKFSAAREGLTVLLDAGESGVALVIGLGSHFLRLAIGAVGGERALAQVLPPHQRWLASRIGRQAKHWAPAELDAALDDLLRADRLLKSTSLNDRQIMEELLLRLEVRPQRVHA